MASEEIMLIINEIEGHTVQDQALNPDILTSPTNTDLKVEEILYLIAEFSIRHIIIRKNNTNLVTMFNK